MDRQERDELDRAKAELEEYVWLLGSQGNVPLFTGMILQSIIERLGRLGDPHPRDSASEE